MILIERPETLPISLSPALVEEAAQAALHSGNAPEIADLTIVLTNDAQLQQLNRQFLGIDAATDVLSFPIYEHRGEIPDDRESLLGDIVINLDAAKRQSSLYRLTLYGEVRRLLVHGFLHLLGYDHERNSYQQKKMSQKENEIRNALEAVD